LERIEAATGRIKAPWEQLPSADDLDELGGMVCPRLAGNVPSDEAR
jgi:hypothetical protein